MFEGLFDESDGVGLGDSGLAPPGGGVDIPPPPRLSCGLAGINNQGATCYLNSLLQTLLYTPDFRDCLFSLTEEELGRLEEIGKPGCKVRVIPIQLQRLFARLLLSDQQSISTSELTDSFGWTNHEELQQQDVQELNRILFSAIEDSLVGTMGQGFISRLYHGRTVNQIICQECHRISEREEDFLDLTLTVTGHISVEHALSDYYCVSEKMEGRNQYRCEKCNKLVDAKKGAKLRSLPSVLTISLLRFSFDFHKMERYKETGKMTFPLTLDMSPFMEQTESVDSELFELFSVVIHRGGAHGGHYHAYIRDIHALGNWTSPEEEEIRLPIDPSTGSVDYLEVDCPQDLVTALLLRAGHQGLSMDKLCSEMTKQTGVSWNKRFKKQYGPINKFLKKHDELFDFNQAANWVSLKSRDKSAADVSPAKRGTSKNDAEKKGERTSDGASNNMDSKATCDKNINKCTTEKQARPQTPAPLPGYCWFNFDDSRVHPISEKELEKQFSGKESAYMLFYRRVPSTGINEKPKDVPDRLVTMVMSENEELHQRRVDYDIIINSITVQVHFGVDYEYRMGALQPQDQSSFTELTLDRRKTLADLAQQIIKVGGEKIPEQFVVHRMQTLPAGGHLFEEIPTDDESVKLQDYDIISGTQLFVWNGETVQGEIIPCGHDLRPLSLTVIYGNPSKFSRGFPKNMTLQQMKVTVGDLLGLEPNDYELQKLKRKGEDILTVEFKPEERDLPLEDLKLIDGDEVVVIRRGSEGSAVLSSLCSSVTRMCFRVENRCGQILEGYSWPVIEVEVDKDATVGELKQMALSKAGLEEVPEGGRLRVDHEVMGLKPPLYEELSLSAAHLSPLTPLVMEPGAAPLTNQITLTFTAADLKDCPYMEMTVDRGLSVGACLSRMIDAAGFSGDAWHLRKTNWCGDLAEILDDVEKRLEDAPLHHGDHVVLEEGKLPPKGYLRLPVSLYPSPNAAPGADNSDGMLSWISRGIQGLLAPSSSPLVELDYSPMLMGYVEISKEATLEDLKLQVMTLPQVMDLPIPSPDFLRLRLVEQGRLSSVLKGPAQTLQRLKLNSSSQLAIQVLFEEEKLTQSQMVLSMQQRLSESRSYGPAVEIVWDTSRGASATCLRQRLADNLCIPAHQVALAKYFPQRYDWMPIQEVTKKSGSHKGKKKTAQPKGNLKNSPYFIKDGDVIGVKDLTQAAENRFDFSTAEDDAGRERLKEEDRQKRQRRKDSRKNALSAGDGLYVRKRQEVGLHIKVDDFR
ncbi:ubiquitin carboxyl-terminal hydrolase 40-like [Liolophura sinensis]|uniref:ubiquitin carboxyl-terminal hydrolase 40-like n=1 Tax=Liolophura sinensis TaxID=3198878 RepID=UPI0031585273